MLLNSVHAKRNILFNISGLKFLDNNFYLGKKIAMVTRK